MSKVNILEKCIDCGSVFFIEGLLKCRKDVENFAGKYNILYLFNILKILNSVT